MSTDGIKKGERSKLAKLESLYSKYGKKRVLKAIDSLDDFYSKILKLYYGLDGTNPKNSQEIGDMYGVKARSIETTKRWYMNKIISFLESKSDDYTLLKKTDQKTKRIRTLFAKYGEEETLKVIETFGEKEKNILLMYFGISGYEQKSAKEIGELYNLNSKSIEDMIFNRMQILEKLLSKPDATYQKGSKKKGRRLYELYSKYGEEAVLNAIKQLKDNEQKCLNMYYGINGEEEKSAEEITQMLGVALVTFNASIKRYFDKIENIINNKFDVKGNKGKKIKSLYEKYGEEIVLEEIKKLPKKDCDIIIMYYGLDGSEGKSANEIGLIYDMKSTAVSSLINKNIEKIERLLNNVPLENKRDIKKEKLEALYKVYGKEKVLNAVNKLTKRNREIMNLYLGINGEAKNIKEISEILGLKERSISTLISANFRQLSIILNRNEKTENQTVNALITMYGENAVMEGVYSLNERAKNILIKYYGLDDKNPKTISELADMYGVSYKTIEMHLNKYVNKLERILAEGSRFGFTKKTKFDKLCIHYGKAAVFNTFNKFDGIDKEIVDLYIGISVDKKSIDEICALYGYKNYYVLSLISSFMQKLETSIKEEKRHNELKQMPVHQLNMIIETEGEEKVKMAVSRLSIREQEILEMYLKRDRNSSDEDKYYDVLMQIIQNVKDEIEDMKEENILKEDLIRIRQKKFMNLLIIKNKEILSNVMKKVTNEEAKVIALYYGLDNKNVCNINELGIYMNTSNYRIRKMISETINKINYLMKLKAQR